MVWYVRFLKTPKIDQKGHVRTLITITTDLGDLFYPADLILHAMITRSEKDANCMSEWQTVQWKSGMRTLWIDIVNIDARSRKKLRLVVNLERNSEGNIISGGRVPEILGAWSGTFDREQNQASSIIERRYRTDLGLERVITEETGESIARHIW